jgi:hypothetical protein
VLPKSVPVVQRWVLIAFLAYPVVALSAWFGSYAFEDGVEGLLLLIPVSHFAFGVIVARWWASGLPLAYFLTAAAIVDAPHVEGGWFIDFVLVACAGIGALSIAAGVGVRRLARTRTPEAPA